MGSWQGGGRGDVNMCATDPKNASKGNIYWVNQKINFMIDTAGNHALTLETETLTVSLVSYYTSQKHIFCNTPLNVFQI